MTDDFEFLWLKEEDTKILRLYKLRFLVLLIAIIGITSIFALDQLASAAPPDTPGESIGQTAQAADVTLKKSVSDEVVTLGQPVTYTISIQNDGSETIDATLTDELVPLPNGLALQNDTVTSTVGIIEVGDNVVNWSGQLAPGEKATVSYTAIPPTSSSADQELENVAILTFDNNTLQSGVTISTEAPDLGIWGSFVNFIAKALVFFDVTLESVGIPYAFGFAIITFTLLVRAATFPLNMQQIKSSKGMQELQPKLKELQEKYKKDREKLAQEQMALYKEHGINPLGGCLPMVVQMPIWIALYRALIQLSGEGLLKQGFFWIPSLAGPVSTWGGGLDWLWPLPPSIGWASALAYLVLPVLLVVSQLYMQNILSPPSTDPQQAQMQRVMKFMPLMFGYFALIVPSGLTLYWFTSNILGLGQHYFTRTQFDKKPATAGATVGSSSPVPASASTPLPATSSEGEKKRKNGKSKRKSRRKR